jgi:hypothetical protein
MNKTLIALLIVGLTIILGVVSLFGYGISVFNTANTLKITYEAKISSNEADFDNMRKTIGQTTQVSKAQMDKLKEIYVQYADARTSDAAGAVMNWVQESVPNVDSTTFNNLQNIIVAGRNGWTARQRELVDISREYNALLVKFPSNILLGTFGFQKINPLIISSSDTKESFSSGEENNTKLDF